MKSRCVLPRIRRLTQMIIMRMFTIKMVIMRMVKSMEARMMKTMATRRPRKQRMACLSIFMLDKAFKDKDSNEFLYAGLIHILRASVHILSWATYDWS